MSKYASLLFTTEEYHYIGPFRFPVFHDLLPGEAEQIELISKRQVKSSFKSLKLAKKIADAKGITPEAAMDLLGKVSEEENKHLLFDYAEELEAMQDDDVSVIKQQKGFVTPFMAARGETKLPGTDEWVQTSDWNEADTNKTPQKLLGDIFTFIIWERDGWPTSEEGNVKPAAKKSPRSTRA